jgi:predicted enzyme related to lactoylglutathione lyase
MAETKTSQTGRIGWIDLTVPNAGAVRDFYEQVTGWTISEVDMGGYNDYCVHPPGAEEPVAGICHARGSNADLPPVWLVYIHVDDLDESVRRTTQAGGKIRKHPTGLGSMGRYCVIEDPAGAVAALFEAPKK